MIGGVPKQIRRIYSMAGVLHIPISGLELLPGIRLSFMWWILAKSLTLLIPYTSPMKPVIWSSMSLLQSQHPIRMERSFILLRRARHLQVIALSYGVSVQTILDNNGLKSSNIIYPDQSLVIQKPAGDTTPGAKLSSTPAATQTTAPTFTPRPPSTETPVPTLAPPTPTVTPTPKPQGQNPINIGTIGLGAVVLGIIILIIYFIMNRPRN